MDAEFVDGLIVKGPRQGAPDFVKGSISIKRQELINWLSQKPDEWINLDIKVSRAGKWYSQVNTWKPNQDGAPAATPAAAVIPAAGETPAPAPSGAEIEYPQGYGEEEIPF